MRDLYVDDYESVAGGNAGHLIPERVRRLSGAAVFVALIAVLGVWSFRLGTRDAAEVPIIKAMQGPSRVEPKDPGGLQAAHQGLEVNAVLAGKPAPMPRTAPAAAPAPAALQDEDAPQGELVLAAPAALAEKVLAEGLLGDDADLPMPAQEATDGSVGTSPEAAVAAALAAAPADADASTATEPRPRSRPANLASRPKKTEAVAAKSASNKTLPEARAADPKTAEAKAVTPKPLAATKVASTAPAREVSEVRTGTRLVQLGAFDSEDITRKAWSQVVAKNPDLLAATSLYVERTTANARVFYRLRVAGFQSSEETRQMCEALRARGIACIPVTLQ